MIEGKATLKASKWGRVISLAEMGITLPNKRDMAFLEHGGNCRDFELEKIYKVQLLFLVTYISIKVNAEGREERTGASFRTKTYEAALNHPEFIRMKLNESKIVPYFEIIK